MNVRVQFFSHLRDAIGTSSVDVDLGEGASVFELLQKLYDRFPILRQHDKSILVGAGVEFVERDYKIRASDDVAVMPPVQGG